jgi:hypothetical protein
MPSIFKIKAILNKSFNNVDFFKKKMDIISKFY